MANGFWTKLRAGAARLFPERQIYHRSRGEVHFVTIPARTQMVLIAVTLAFLTWVAFTSVNVVFKDQIIESKDRRFNEMQANYETRVNRLQREIDNVNGAMRVTQDRFERELELLEERQEQLDRLMEDQEVLNLEHEDLRNRVAVMGNDPMNEAAEGTSVLAMDVSQRETAMRQGRPLPPVRASTVDGVSTVLATIAQGGGHVRNALTTRATRIAHMEDMARDLRTTQRDAVLSMENRAVERIGRLQTILASTGLDLDDYMSAFNADEFNGVGGPGIDIQDLEPFLEEDEDTADFSRYLIRASNHLDELSILQAAINNLPLLRPSDLYRMTDGYGMRRDPFNRRLRMHYGLDFAGPSGTPVMATAAGTVTRAGTMSGYGRVIEIDHGNGISTRYAHLRRINVSVGDEVSARQVIGQLGNTGRSTGPHVHYEVRYHGEPLDPLPFLEAGRHVFES